MYFKLFSINANINKQIKNVGFSINTYRDVSVFRGTERVFTSTTPNNYLYKGDIWQEIDAAGYNERAYLLAKTPYLAFDELWNLALQTNNEDDRIGSLIFMNKFYYAQLRQKYKILNEKNKDISKAEKRVLCILAHIM